MEYAMFRRPRGESSNAADTLAKYIMAETRHLGIPVSLKFDKRKPRAISKQA